MKFSELPERVKQKLRDKHTGEGYLDYEWWDFIYEGAIRMGKLIGIEIGERWEKTVSGKLVTSPAIYFSGFSHQGSFCSYDGSYSHKPDAVQTVTDETNDEELIRIAQELVLLQVTRRLQGKGEFSAKMEDRNSSTSVDITSYDLDGNNDGDIDDIEDDVQKLMRDFGEWIYDQLESQNDYLYSDECVDEALSSQDEEYDEDGDIVEALTETN